MIYFLKVDYQTNIFQKSIEFINLQRRTILLIHHEARVIFYVKTKWYIPYCVVKQTKGCINKDT